MGHAHELKILLQPYLAHLKKSIDMTQESPQSSSIFKILSFIARKPQFKIPKGTDQIILSYGEKFLSLSTQTLSALVTKGLIKRSDKTLELTDKGRNVLPENNAYRSIEIYQIEKESVAFNRTESPLLILAHRKKMNGEPFLTLSEIEAGERIRSDFTCGVMMPNISSNWSLERFDGVRNSGVNDMQHLSVRAISAREAFHSALGCLGRDLAGVVTDICCYLEGFEQVELERRWPKRSAKFMLKAALSVLALHYNPPMIENSKIHVWGAEDYKPIAQ
jgi:predicted transcriptional regulator